MLTTGNGTAAKQQESVSSNTTSLAALVPLLWEICNLKRIKTANVMDSFATNLFYRAWGGINGGASIRNVAVKITADVVVGANLGAINAEILRNTELSDSEIQIILERAFDSVSAPVATDLRDELRRAVVRSENFPDLSVPSFVGKLARQPRSGATKLNAPKLIFDAPENHAEHCVTVAVFAVLLTPIFKADLETVFLTALAHHFHNADLPDSGFAGEEMLGEYLPKIFARLREKCLLELPENVRERVRQTFALTKAADSPEAKTFHAADVLDRVLQMRHHAEAAKFNLKYALEEMELVHAGEIQSFHYEILQAAELI